MHAFVCVCVCESVCVKNRGSGRSCQGKSPRLHATFLPPQFFPSFSQSVCLCQCLLYFYGWPASSHARWIFLDLRTQSVCPDLKISKTNLHLMTHGCPSTLGPDITLCVTLRIQPFCFGKEIYWGSHDDNYFKQIPFFCTLPKRHSIYEIFKNYSLHLQFKTNIGQHIAQATIKCCWCQLVSSVSSAASSPDWEFPEKWVACWYSSTRTAALNRDVSGLAG